MLKSVTGIFPGQYSACLLALGLNDIFPAVCTFHFYHHRRSQEQIKMFVKTLDNYPYLIMHNLYYSLLMLHLTGISIFSTGLLISLHRVMNCQNLFLNKQRIRNSTEASVTYRSLHFQAGILPQHDQIAALMQESFLRKPLIR